MIEVNQLCKEFTDKKRGVVRAVQGVSFSCRPGEIFGLLGPNGAGKTTTLRMLATILEPTSGTATVAGHDVQREPQAVRINIGYLSGSTALYERLTAREMVAYFGALFGLAQGEIDQRIQEIFTELDMHEFADRRCDKLSTGQKQRVSIARTILHDPPVLFFDEPTAGLDVLASQSVMEFIEEARTMGKTIIFSTHIMSEVERLCDNVVVIHDGKVRSEGSVATLLQEAGEQSLEKAFLKLVGHESKAVPA